MEKEQDIIVENESKEFEQNKAVDSENTKEETTSPFENESKEVESTSFDQEKTVEDSKEVDIITFDDTGNDKAEAIIDGNRVEMTNEEAFTLALENGVDQEALQAFAEEKGLQDDFNAAMDAKGLETEEVTTITFDPENETAMITENGETREVSATEAFEYALENGDIDKETLHDFAEEHGLQENFREAESNEFMNGIQEQNSAEDFVQSANEGYEQGVQEAENQIEADKPQIEINGDSATITENGETREVSVQEAFEFAIEQGEDKESLKAFAEEHGLGEDFNKAAENSLEETSIKDSVNEAANEAGNAFAEGLGDALSDSIIENNKNSEVAFDRGMSEMFEQMDKEHADQGMER